MKKPILTLALLLVLAVPSHLVGQDNNSEGEIVLVTSLRILPKDVERFAAAVHKLVQAAEQAQLDADFGWSVWTDQFVYHIVSSEKNMAGLDGGDERWMKQFEGTPGQATLAAAFEELAEIPSENLGSEITQVVPAWTYGLDKIPEQPGFAEVCEYSIAAGMEEKFDGVYKDYIGMITKLGYPYGHIGHRFRFGSPASHVGVTIYDTKEYFFGRNDIERLVEQKGMGDAWAKLYAEFLPTVTAVDCSHMAYVPEMSYRPTPSTQ